MLGISFFLERKQPWYPACIVTCVKSKICKIMKKVSTLICKYLSALYGGKSPYEVSMLKGNALSAIEIELCRKYPSEMSGKVEVDYMSAREIRTFGQFGLIPNALFVPIFLIMYKRCKMSTEVTARLFKDAYTTGRSIYKDEYLHIFDDLGQSDFLYDDELKSEYSVLPEHLTIYRGGSMNEYDKCDFGCSWSTDRACAEFFAFRFTEHQRAVFSMEVEKSEIIYFGNNRNENEVLYIKNICKELVSVVTVEPTEFYKKWYSRR